MKHTKKPGYIMIFTLLVIAASMVIASYVSYRGAVHTPFVHMVVAREKAYMLALGGVQIAIAQLAKVPEKEEKKEKKAEGQGQEKQQASAGDNEYKFLLQNILPTINNWQTFQLDEQRDGIEGEISLCLMCEEGKININKVYNFKKEMFRGEKEAWKDALQELCKSIEKVTKINDLFPVFEKMFKERRHKYNDATELLAKKEFNYFKDLIFYAPPVLRSSKSEVGTAMGGSKSEAATTDKEKKQQQQIYLTDVFTVWTDSGKIEPWLFSHSLMVLFGLQQEEDAKKRKESVEGWLKNFKQKADWEKDWKTILQPIYGKELRSLPKHIDSMLSTTFDPHFFSVRVHATVDTVTQRLYAILERVKRSQGDEIVYDVLIRKLYWL